MLGMQRIMPPNRIEHRMVKDNRGPMHEDTKPKNMNLQPTSLNKGGVISKTRFLGADQYAVCANNRGRGPDNMVHS